MGDEKARWSTPHERCPTHDLALGPDGRCVLCKRTEAPPPRSGSVLAGSLAVVLVVLVAILVHRELQAFDASFAMPARVRPEPVAAPPPRAAPPAEPEPVAAAEPPRPRRSRSRVASAEPTETAEPTVDPARPPPPVRIAPAADEVGPDRPGEPPGLAAARRRVRITMYGASWCGYCRRAREYLRENDIRYTYRDVDEDRWRAELLERNPGGSVPTFDVADRILVGYSEPGLMAAIDVAAHDLLGR